MNKPVATVEQFVSSFEVAKEASLIVDRLEAEVDIAENDVLRDPPMVEEVPIILRGGSEEVVALHGDQKFVWLTDVMSATEGLVKRTFKANLWNRGRDGDSQSTSYMVEGTLGGEVTTEISRFDEGREVYTKTSKSPRLAYRVGIIAANQITHEAAKRHQNATAAKEKTKQAA